WQTLYRTTERQRLSRDFSTQAETRRIPRRIAPCLDPIESWLSRGCRLLPGRPPENPCRRWRKKSPAHQDRPANKRHRYSPEAIANFHSALFGARISDCLNFLRFACSRFLASRV